MSRMLKSDWISKVGRKGKTPLARSQRALSCEPLEDRRLLATVTSGADDGAPGTLRVALATGDATIDFDSSVTMVTLTMGELTVLPTTSLIDGTTGVGGTDRVTIMQTTADRIMSSASDLTLGNLIMTGGNTTGSGGAVNATGTLTLQDSDVTGNTAAVDGGGIYLRGNSANSLYLYDSVLEGNFALDDGGGFAAINPINVVVQDSDLLDNQAGALIADGGPIGASVRGGGGYVLDNANGEMKVTVTGSTISGNSAIAETTAADYPNMGDLAVRGSARGAGLEIQDFAFTATGADSVITVDNSTFAYNDTFTPDQDPADNDPALPNTTSDARGGAALLYLVSEVTVTNSNFYKNYSYDDGSGLAVGAYQNNMLFTMDNTTITGNGFGEDFGREGAGGGAGGLWVIAFPGAQACEGACPATGPLNSTITNSEITGNSSAFGANVQFQQGGIHTLSDSTVTGGVGLTRGAGVYALTFSTTYDMEVTIDNTTIANNTAGLSGGGVRGQGNSRPNEIILRNSTVSGNRIDRGFPGGDAPPAEQEYSGAGVDLTDTDLTVIQSTVSGNEALFAADSLCGDQTAGPVYCTEGGGFGGGIAVKDATSSADISNSTITDNDATGWGTYAAYNSGGVYSADGGSVVLTSSIVSGNTINGGAADSDCYQGTLAGSITQTDSLVGTNEQSGTGGTCNGLVADMVLIGPDALGDPIDAQLGTLGDNGGNTQTHEPMAGSPAIEMGSNPLGLTEDQRGEARTAGLLTDIGSVEVQGDELLGDYDGSGLVGAGDLALVLAAWGTNNYGILWVNQIPPGTNVGAGELSPVLGNWGASLVAPEGSTSTTGVAELEVNDHYRPNFSRHAGITAVEMVPFIIANEGHDYEVTVTTTPERTPIAVPVAIQESAFADEAGQEQLKAKQQSARVTQVAVAQQRVSQSLSDTFANRDKEETAVDKVFADLGSDL